MEEEKDFKVISSYPREQAIEDGVLIDISDTSEAKEAGFKIPVCVTSALYEIIKVPKGLEGEQDFKGRLWDVCFMATLEFKKKLKSGDYKEGEENIIPFEVSFAVTFQTTKKRKVYLLWLVFSPVEGFVIMLPEDY